MKSKISIVLSLILLGCTTNRQQTAEFQPEYFQSADLEADFATPPDYAKPRVYWWWLEGFITKEGILSDLSEMKKVGIKGAIVFDAGSSSYNKNQPVTHSNSVMTTPSGPGFMSDTWRDLFTYACLVADSLDLELAMNITSGWNDGGPWVTPEYAAKKIVWSELSVKGPQVCDEKLPLPQHLLTTDDGETFYRPVAVLALKLTEQSPAVKPLENFALKAVHAINLPRINGLGYDWSIFMKEEPSPEGDCHASLREVINLTDKVDAEGILHWNVPEGDYLIMSFGYTGTGIRVSTHSPGCGGLAIDYMSEASTDLQYGNTAAIVFDDLKKAGAHSLKYLHDDSWELGAANWTAGMENLFRKANGYDILPYLPVIAGRIIESRDVSNRFLYDFRRTIADLIWKNHYIRFKNLAHADGVGVHPESGGPHPAPIDALKNVGVNDIPMGEFWIRANTHRVVPEARLFIKQPASAAHIYGKRFVQAEGPTSIGPHWEEDFAYMKPTLDRVYCEGLNRLVIHTFTHSPREAGIPGNEYFAGTHFNPNVTWWKQAPAFLTWNSRISLMLSQGLFVGDVCYYYGDNVPNQVPLKHINEDLGEGYDYDVCNTEVILERMTARDGKIYLPDGMHYEALVLPERIGVTSEVMDKIEKLVKDGATIVGSKPVTSPGLRGDGKAIAKIKKQADALWGNSNGKHPYGKGFVFSGQPVRDVLLSKGVQPDFGYESRKPDALIDYIHRQTEDADIYYVVNRNERPEYIRATFRSDGKVPELWNPETGSRVDQPVYASLDGLTSMPLFLEPFGSVFVVFRKPAAGHYVGLSLNGTNLFPEVPQDTFATIPFLPRKETGLLFIQPGEYTLKTDAGETKKIQVEPPVIQPVSTPWDVAFNPVWGGPEHIRFDKLIRWDTHTDPAIRHYSGTAEYTNTFTLTAGQYAGKRVWLDLGEMYNIAEVSVNGQSAGVWWQPPFSHDITELVKDGENRLQIKVVNLWPNRLLADARLPEEKRLTKTNVVKFTLDLPLRPSGLAGPVRIQLFNDKFTHEK
ncbi:hypothetical protein AGMMS49965_16570 [Bacteroidia bacterium]|nr:hypothetical protein AGMMS49965_16570 [Bacteroidia bacterium]